MNCVDTTVTQSPERHTHKQKPPTIKPPQTKPSKGQLKWHSQLLIIKSHQGQNNSNLLPRINKTILNPYAYPNTRNIPKKTKTRQNQANQLKLSSLTRQMRKGATRWRAGTFPKTRLTYIWQRPNHITRKLVIGQTDSPTRDNG